MSKLKKKLALAWALLFFWGLNTSACSNLPVGHATAENTKQWVRFSKAAKNDIKNRQYKKALTNIELAIDAEPSEYPLHLGKAEILEKLGRRQNALDYLTSLIRKNPLQSEYIELRGRFLLQLGYWESAREDLYSVFEKEEKRTLVLLQKLIELEQKSKKPGKGKLLVDAALKIAPENSALWFQKGKLELGAFKFRDAQESLEKAIDLKESNLAYHQLYIETLLLLNNKPAVETHLQKMIQLFPEDAWGNLRLAAIWVENGHLESAKLLLEGALRKHPSKALIYYQLGTLYAKLKNWKTSLNYYLEGIKRDSNSNWANIQVAKIYARIGDVNAVVVHLKSAFDRGSANIYVFESLAKIYNQRDDTYAAEKVIIEGLRISSKNQILLSEYGNLFEKRGNLKEAIRAYQEILTIQPRNFYVHGKMGNLFRLLRQFDRAEKSLLKAKKLSPKTSWVRAYLIEMFAEQKRWTEALREIEQMISLRTVDYWPYARKGLILQKLHEYPKSLDAINNSISFASRDKVEARWLFEVRGEILASLGRYDEAEKSMLQANNPKNDDPIVLTKLAYIQNNIDQDRALSTINKVIQLEDVDLSSIELYIYLTGQHSKYWNFKKGSLAEQTYIKIIRKNFAEVELNLKDLAKLSDPHVPFLTYLRDFLLLGRRAKLVVPENLKTETPFSWHNFYLGIHELNFGKKLTAKIYFNKALKGHPDNPWIIIKQAFTLENLKESKTAIVLLKNFLLQFPDNNWARIRLALNYDLALEHRLSEKTYLEILKRQPEEHVVLNNLAWLYLTTSDDSLKKVDEALLLSQRAVKLKATSANLDTLAEAFYQKKEYSNALKSIERALDIDRKNLDYFKKQKKKILKAMIREKKTLHGFDPIMIPPLI